jgi:hypothetical protein
LRRPGVLDEPKPRKPATDAMICRSCGREERASEGYPCDQCGTFICLICNFRGVTTCKTCSGAPAPADGTAG